MKKLYRLLISCLLLGILAWRIDWAHVGEAFGQLNVGLCLSAFGVYLVTQVLSSWRWQILSRPLGFERSLSQLTAFYFIGMYFNLLLPTSVGGDVVRAYYLDGKSGRRLSAFLAVFMDRFNGLLALLTMACIAVAFCPVAIPAWVTWSVWGTGCCAAVGLTLLPIVIRWTDRFERVRRLVDSGRMYLTHPRLLVKTTLLSVVVQSGGVAMVWLVGKAIGAPVPGAYYWILVPMVSLLTLLPVSLNGMGVREGATVLFLSPLGVPEGTALSLAFLWFAVGAMVSLCGAVVYLFGSFSRPEVQSDDESVGDRPDQGRTRQFKAAA